MNIKYTIKLTDDERGTLDAMLKGGSRQARKLKRAQILLAADQGATDAEIAKSVHVGTSTVYRIKRRMVEGGLELALNDDPRPGGQRSLSGKEEALLVATACSTAPQGRARWTIELLAGEMVRLLSRPVSRETIRRRLKEKELKPWQKKMWCVPKVDSEYVARMEDVLDLYAEQPDAKHPVVCFDETPTQLVGESRTPVPTRPGLPARIDYEYVRNGTANIFLFLDAHRPWRHVKVTNRKTCQDFAHCMRDLVDLHYPQAERIRVVLDNLSAHSAGALYQAFPAEEARRVLRRLEFHFVPKHASWLNMVEIEIGVLVGQCLDRRIPDLPTLEREVAAWERLRNESKAKVNWLFTVERARNKLGRSYPPPSNNAPSHQAAAA